MSRQALDARFSNEEGCAHYLANRRWPDGWPCRDSCGFFNRRYRANSSATPSAVFPRVSGGISFRKNTRFVSDFSREKIDQWSQCVAGHENLKRNETQKNRHAEVCKCGASHPHASPPGRTRDFRTTGATPGGCQPAAGKAFHSVPAARRSLFRGKGGQSPRYHRAAGGPKLYGRADQIASTGVITHWRNNRAEVPGMRRRSRRPALQ